MKNNAIYFSITLALVLIASLVTVSAGALSISIDRVEMKNVDVSPSGATVLSAHPGENIPITVQYTAHDDYDDLKMKVWIDGYKDEVSSSTGRFDVISGDTDTKLFSLTLPPIQDMDDKNETLTLNVRISDKNDEVEEEYTIRLKREQYSLDVLSVEAPGQATAGDTIALDVVLKNIGNQRIDDVFVTARIPELGVSRRIYFGDITPEDEDDRAGAKQDAVERRVYLTIPTGVPTGVYNMEIRVESFDFEAEVTKTLVVTSGIGNILSTATSKDVAIGESTNFDLVVVNPSDRMAIYTLEVVDDVKGLIVTIDEPIVSISADSSKTVNVKVKATESAEEGTQTITINVKSGDEVLKTVRFSANVEKGTSAVVSSVLILTVVLAIIFIVLLVVLIVLLTKKPTRTEDFGEASYY